MWTWNVEIFAYMVDLSDARGIGVDASFDVSNYGVVAPGGFPEFIHYFEILVCNGITFVVLLVNVSASVRVIRVESADLWLLGMTKVPSC